MSLRGRRKGRILCLLLILAMTFGMKAEAKSPCRKHTNSEMKIALTFDDGPDPRYTGEILDILAEYQIKATFFVIGRNCEADPDLVRREIAEGHEVGNHTYSHPHLYGIGAETLKEELQRTEAVLSELGAESVRLFRPPEGVYSGTVAKIAEGLGYLPILWTVDTTDWRMPSASVIAETVLNKAESGVIILCHDYVSGKSNTPAALRQFLPELLRRGYTFVTVSELLAAS